MVWQATSWLCRIIGLKVRRHSKQGCRMIRRFGLSFLALVHSGHHFRYIGPGSLAEAAHTTLFTSFHSDTSSVPYALDFVSYNDLPAALLRIESSFDLLAKHLVRYLKKSPKPFPE